MKRIISMLTAVLMLTSLTATAFAEPVTEDYPENGLTVTYSEDMTNAKGLLYPYPNGGDASGVFLMAYLYFGMPQDEFEAIMEMGDEITEEDAAKMNASQGILQYVFAINGGRGAEELAGETGAEVSDLSEVAKEGEYTFYIMDWDAEQESEYLAGLEPEFAEEYTSLKASLIEALKNAEYYEPEIPGSELVGQKISFETEDIDGNVVKSEDIFAEHKITMVNVWGTWCGPCKGELAGLGEMNRGLADKNCAVIGIIEDGLEDGKVEVARGLLEENNVDYLNLIPQEGLLESLDIQGFPSSYFVDSEGTILAPPVVGAPSDMSSYEEVFNALLAGEEAVVETAPPVAENGEGVYRVIVADEDGEMVEGAMVQFCSDTSCMMGKTDAEGIASFEAEEGEYTVHVLKVPEGYEGTNEEFPTLDTYCDICVTLQKTE